MGDGDWKFTHPESRAIVYLFLFNLFSFVFFLLLISQRPCFVFRHPTTMVRNVFLTPFSKYVWYCIVASGCLIICIAVVISYREMKNYYRRPGKWYFNGNELLWRWRRVAIDDRRRRWHATTDQLHVCVAALRSRYYGRPLLKRL